MIKIENDGFKIDEVCNRCGKLATIFDFDPYVKEIHSEILTDEDELWWCDFCYQDQLDNI